MKTPKREEPMSDKNLNIAAVAAKEPILVVEDTKENQDLIIAVCKRLGIRCDIAENGAVALEMCARKNYPVYIVDLMMPVMDGRTFIEKLRQKDPEAIVLVQTAVDSSETIIHVMKLGVFDYIIKPIDPEMFRDSLFKAIDYYYLKKFEKEQSLSAGLKIRNQIEWLSLKESLRMAGAENVDTKSIQNLKTSLAQGAGFGSLVTLIDMLVDSAEEADGDYFRVSKDVINMLGENNKYCRLQLEGLHFASDILDQEIELQDHRAVDLVSYLPKMLARVSPFLKEKNLSLTFPDLRDDCKLAFNLEKVSLILEEIIVNTYKYSIHGTAINIFTRINEGYFWLSVKNDVSEKPYGGVPPQYEKLVLEPFFRIHPPDESAARFERIGFGLGLAVADYVMKKHNGIFIIHDVRDLTGDKNKLCVLSEMLFPVQK
jgi:CheY-like chemotaxis protein